MENPSIMSHVSLGTNDFEKAKAFYLATCGSAQTMRLDGRIGNVAAGCDADLVVLNLHSTPAIAHRMRYAESVWDVLFVQMMMADDRAIRATYVNGRKRYVSPCG